MDDVARPSRPAHYGAERLLAAGSVLLLALLGCTAEPEGGPAGEGTGAPPQETPGQDRDGVEEPAPTGDPDPTGEPEPSPTPEEPPLSQQGVSAAHPEAVAVGEQVLADGGNAVDAAVATAFAISVVEPFASGIGGGGATILAGPELDPVTVDYREEVARDGRIPDSGTGVPGFAAGMDELHAEHGSLPWADLLAGAEELAAEGFAVSDFLELRMRSDFGPAAVEGQEHLAPGGEPLEEGDLLVQEDLAQTLDRLAEHGAEDLYTGQLAEALVAEEGLDADTLQDYAPVTTDPVSGTMGDHQLLSAAPPLPGAAVIQQMQHAEAAGIGELEPGGVEHLVALAEAWEAALDTVETELGDPRFVDVPVDELTEPAAHGINGPAAPAVDPAGRSTTHLAVVDEEGLTVSMTNTITSFWGSGEMVGGFFLNDQLSRFDAVDSPANQPEPGRRSVSWSAPSMVLDAEGRPVLAIGTPGGPQIPTILAEVLTRWSLQGQSLEDAVAAPRSHLDGEVLLLEEEPEESAVPVLEDHGWTVEVVPPDQAVFGSVQALEIDQEAGTVHGADDTRREGAHSILD